MLADVSPEILRLIANAPKGKLFAFIVMPLALGLGWLSKSHPHRQVRWTDRGNRTDRFPPTLCICRGSPEPSGRCAAIDAEFSRDRTAREASAVRSGRQPDAHLGRGGVRPPSQGADRALGRARYEDASHSIRLRPRQAPGRGDHAQVPRRRTGDLRVSRAGAIPASGTGEAQAMAPGVPTAPGGITFDYSYEAKQHLRHIGQSDKPVCRTLAGLAIGYGSRCMGAAAFAFEDRCVGKGDPTPHRSELQQS